MYINELRLKAQTPNKQAKPSDIARNSNMNSSRTQNELYSRKPSKGPDNKAIKEEESYNLNEQKSSQTDVGIAKHRSISVDVNRQSRVKEPNSQKTVLGDDKISVKDVFKIIAKEYSDENSREIQYQQQPFLFDKSNYTPRDSVQLNNLMFTENHANNIQSYTQQDLSSLSPQQAEQKHTTLNLNDKKHTRTESVQKNLQKSVKSYRGEYKDRESVQQMRSNTVNNTIVNQTKVQGENNSNIDWNENVHFKVNDPRTQYIQTLLSERQKKENSESGAPSSQNQLRELYRSLDMNNGRYVEPANITRTINEIKQREKTQNNNFFNKTSNLSATAYRPENTSHSGFSIEEKEIGFSTHFNFINKKNEQYFNHLKGTCRCGKCQCPRVHQCVTRNLQYDYARQVNSQYSDQFYEKSVDIPKPFPLDKDPYRDTLRMDNLDSTHRVDFNEKKKNDQITEVNRNTLTCGYQLIDQNTLYQSEFQNYVPPKSVLFTHIPQSNVPHQLPWKGNTESRLHYKGEVDQPDYQIVNFALDRKQYQPPLGIDADFSVFGQSSYEGFYQQNPLDDKSEPKVQWGAQDNKQKNTHVYISPPQFKGQFLSTTQMNFYQKADNFCPASSEQPDELQRLGNKYYHN